MRYWRNVPKHLNNFPEDWLKYRSVLSKENQYRFQVLKLKKQPTNLWGKKKIVHMFSVIIKEQLHESIWMHKIVKTAVT